MLAHGYNRDVTIDPCRLFDEKLQKSWNITHETIAMGVPRRSGWPLPWTQLQTRWRWSDNTAFTAESQRWPGKPVMDIQIIMKSLTERQRIDPERDGRAEAKAITTKDTKVAPRKI